jgi:glycosyltransferase involved in cell wall biosynthesis
MGRHSAGAGFLSGFLKHAEVDAFRFRVTSREHREHLKRRVADEQPLRRPVEAIWPDQPDRLSAVGALQLAEPRLGEAAWARRITGDRAYSLCGLTHSISSLNALELFGQYLVAPVQPWDALICTSRCVQGEVRGVLEEQAEYLSARIGRRPEIPLQLPVIPLGVDSTSYDDDPARRAALRARIGASDQDVVVLFLGRLSYHAKANPLPLVQAAARASERTRSRLHVLFVGQFPNPGQEGAFRSTAEFAPGVGVHFLPGEDPEVVEEAWRGADIFASLSDNIQESFGLTVIEAMAAGLPVLASDWNGYRDTVQDGLTGIRVPTTFPPPGTGAGLAARHQLKLEDYDHYVGTVAFGTAVDVEAAAKALTLLAEDPDLRRRMGAAGRVMARETFDWRHVVRAHQSLWAELARIREHSPGLGVRTGGQPAHPLHRDPFTLFASHASRSMKSTDLITLNDRSRLEALLTSPAAGPIVKHLSLSAGEIRALVGDLAAGPILVEDAAQRFGPEKRCQTALSLIWLMKFGVVSISPTGR